MQVPVLGGNNEVRECPGVILNHEMPTPGYPVHVQIQQPGSLRADCNDCIRLPNSVFKDYWRELKANPLPIMLKTLLVLAVIATAVFLTHKMSAWAVRTPDPLIRQSLIGASICMGGFIVIVPTILAPLCNMYKSTENNKRDALKFTAFAVIGAFAFGAWGMFRYGH